MVDAAKPDVTLPKVVPPVGVDRTVTATGQKSGGQKSLFSNSVALIVLRGTVTSTRLLVLFAIARSSAPGEFGLIAFAIAIAEIARVVADCGVDTVAVRQFAVLSDRSSEMAFAKTVAIAKALGAIGVYIATVLFFLRSVSSHELLLCAVAALLIITGVAGTFATNYYQARLAIQRVLLPVVLINAATIGTILISIWMGSSSLSAVAILPIAEALTALVITRILLRDWKSNEYILVHSTPQRWDVVSLLRAAAPVAVSNVIIVVYTKLDVVILTQFLGKSAVGFYSVAFRMTEPFQMIAAGFALSLFSHLSGLVQRSDQAHEKGFVIRYIGAVAIYGLVAAAILEILAPFIIRRFLPFYIPAIGILRLLAVALVFRTINTNLSSVVMAYGRYRWMNALVIWNLLMVSTALWAFVPLLGLKGAALALLSGEIINSLIQIILVHKAIALAPSRNTRLETAAS